ncbi:MAG: hypothetical protein JWN74_711 [Acidobacteriaceae bacterium]|nr:hypothetical protein [Acidobacteriaceae bacterium]
MSSSPLTDDRRQRSFKRVRTPQPSGPVPDKAYMLWGVPLLVFVIALLYLFLFRRYSAMDPDEGIVLQGAERILHGEVPYRDFFSFYTPGSFYLLAGIFRVFGDSFIVARTSIAIVGAGFTLVTYLLARRVCSRRIALLAAGLSMSTGAAYRFLVLHNWYATFFACLSVYTVVRLLESHKTTWAFATGSFVAFTTLIEQSKGAGLCIGLVIGYVVLRFYSRIRDHRIWAVCLGFVWPWIILFLYFGSRGALRAMLQDWVWPLQHYTKANHVFYGDQSWPKHASDTLFYSGTSWTKILKYLAISPGFVVPVLPLTAIAWLAYTTLRLRKGDSGRNCEYYVLVSATLSGLLITLFIVRPDIIHFMYLAPLWYVALAWTLGAHEIQSRILRILRPYLLSYVCIAFGMMGFALLVKVNGAGNQVQTRRGMVVTSSKDTVISYVQAHTAPGDYLLVYPYLPLYNYLTETHSPARLDFFQAGMNTPEQADEIIASLKSQKNRAVLFEPGFGEKFASSWPETPLRDVANDPVADFIVRNYQVCAPLTASSGWRFQFMVRKEEVCP